MPVFSSLLRPPPYFPALLAVTVVGLPVRVFLPLACRYAIPCGLCVPRPLVGLRFRSAPRARCVCVHSCSSSLRAPPPWVGVARPPRAILGQGAVGAVPGGSCPSAFPAPVLVVLLINLGGVAPSLSSPCLALGRATLCGRKCASGAIRRPGGVGGGFCSPPPSMACGTRSGPGQGRPPGRPRQPDPEHPPPPQAVHAATRGPQRPLAHKQGRREVGARRQHGAHQHPLTTDH